MDAVKETTKVNGKMKVKKAAPKPKPIEKPSKAEKVTGWSIARSMLSTGKPEKEIRAAIHDHLVKTVDPKDAMEFFCQRMSYRMLFRAKRATKKGTKEKKNAA